MHGKATVEEFSFKQMMNPLRAILGQWVFAKRKKAFDSVRWIQSFGLKVLEDLLTKEEGGRRLHQGLCDLSLIDGDPRYGSNEEKLPEILLWAILVGIAPSTP